MSKNMKTFQRKLPKLKKNQTKKIQDKESSINDEKFISLSLSALSNFVVVRHITKKFWPEFSSLKMKNNFGIEMKIHQIKIYMGKFQSARSF